MVNPLLYQYSILCRALIGLLRTLGWWWLRVPKKETSLQQAVAGAASCKCIDKGPLLEKYPRDLFDSLVLGLASVWLLIKKAVLLNSQLLRVRSDSISVYIQAHEQSRDKEELQERKKNN